MHILFVFPIQLIVLSIMIGQCRWDFLYNKYNIKRISLILSTIGSSLLFLLAIFIPGLFNSQGLLLAFLSIITAIFSIFFLVTSKHSNTNYYVFNCIDGEYETYGESRFDRELSIKMINSENETVYINLGLKRPFTDNFTLYCISIQDQFSNNRYKSVFYTYSPSIVRIVECILCLICAMLVPFAYFLSLDSVILKYYYMFIVLFIFSAVIRSLVCSIRYVRIRYRIYYYLFFFIEFLDIATFLLFIIYSLG